MNASKVDELDYIHFLVAAQRVFTTTEAARIRAGELNAPAHACLHASAEANPAGYGSPVAGGGPLCPARPWRVGGGRYHAGQAPCSEDGLGEAPLVGQAQAGGPGHQPDLAVVDRRPSTPALRFSPVQPGGRRPLSGPAANGPCARFSAPVGCL